MQPFHTQVVSIKKPVATDTENSIVFTIAGVIVALDISPFKPLVGNATALTPLFFIVRR